MTRARRVTVLLAAAALSCGRAEPAAPSVRVRAAVAPVAPEPVAAPSSLATDGNVVCWISGGRAHCAGSYAHVLAPHLERSGLRGIAIDWGVACAWDASGETFCGKAIDVPHVSSFRELDVGRITDLALGHGVVCALAAPDAALRCLRFPDGIAIPDPHLGGLGHATDFDVADAACAVWEGRVTCTGANPHALIGHGCRTAECGPTPIPELDHVVAVGVGGSCACALVEGRPEGRTVSCWGCVHPDLPIEQMATTHIDHARWTTAHAIDGLPADIESFQVSWSDTLCARTRNGELYCIGLKQIPGGGTMWPEVTHVASDVIAYAVSVHTVCVLSGAGEVRCFGPGTFVPNPLVRDVPPPGVLFATGVRP